MSWRSPLQLAQLQRLIPTLEQQAAALQEQLVAATAKPVDNIYSRLGNFNGAFFSEGWGDLRVVRMDEDLKLLQNWPPPGMKIEWKKVDSGRKNGIAFNLYEGAFRTPCPGRVYDALPPESRTGRVQLLLPAGRVFPYVAKPAAGPSVAQGGERDDAGGVLWNGGGAHAAIAAALRAVTSRQHRGANSNSQGGKGGEAPSRDYSSSHQSGQQHHHTHHHNNHQQVTGPPSSHSSVITHQPQHPTATLDTSLLHQPNQQDRQALGAAIHLAATGDQGFGRRLRLAFPLLSKGIAAVVHESPYYGRRRPPEQKGSKLQRVSDLLCLGWATIYESMNLLHWLEQEGYHEGGLCMAGMSMGGVHACMTAALYPRDVALAALLAPRSAAVAYCDGALSAAMAWEPLLREVDEAQNNVLHTLHAAAQPVSVMRAATYALHEIELALDIGRGGSHAAAGAAAAATFTEAAASAFREGSSNSGGSISDRRTGEVAGCLASSAGEIGSSLTNGSSSSSNAAAVSSKMAGQSGSSITIGSSSSTSHHTAVQSGVSQAGPASQPASAAPVPSAASASQAQGAAAAAPHNHTHLVLQPPLSTPSHQAADQLDTSTSDSFKQSQQHVSSGAHSPVTATYPPEQQSQQQQQKLQGTGPVGNVQGPGVQPLGSGAAVQRAPQGAVRDPRGQDLKHMLNRLQRGMSELLPLSRSDKRISRHETLRNLKRVLETYTDICRFPVPKRPDAAVFVAATDDAYVSTESVQQLHQYWKGSEMRLVSGGHVTAFLMHQDKFREAINDSITRLKQQRPPQSVP